MMRPSSQRKTTAIAFASFIAGLFAAAMLFSNRSRAEQAASHRSNRPATSNPAVDGVGTDGSVTPIEAQADADRPPIDVKQIAAFAKKLSDAKDTATRAETAIAWFESFSENDFEAFISQLYALDEDEGDFGLSEEDLAYITQFIDEVFDDGEGILGAAFFQAWANYPASLTRTLETLPTEQAIDFGIYTLPFLWGNDSTAGKKSFDDLRRRDPEGFDNSFDEDVFAYQLFQLDEVASVRWRLDHGSDEIYLDDAFSSGITDPDGVLRELLTMDEGDDFDATIESFFEYHIEADPTSALELVERYGGELGEELREEAEEYAKTAWVLEDPASRLKIEDENIIGEVVGEWIIRDPQAVVDWFGGQELLSPEGKAKALERFVSGNFIELPFDFAIEHGSPTDDRYRPFALNSYDSVWAAALSDSQLDQLMKKAPAHGLEELYRRDPQAALEIARKQGEEVVGAAIGNGFQLSGNEARRQWLDLIPGSAASTYFSGWASEDPAAAWEASIVHAGFAGDVVSSWLDYEDVENVYAAVGDRFNQSQKIREWIIDAWVIRDPWTASETLLADGHTDGVPQLITKWIERDSVEASRFIRENLEPGEGRDEAVLALAKGIAERDPEAAREWAESIGDEKRRAELLAEIETP